MRILRRHSGYVTYGLIAAGIVAMVYGFAQSSTTAYFTKTVIIAHVGTQPVTITNGQWWWGFVCVMAMLSQGRAK